MFYIYTYKKSQRPGGRRCCSFIFNTYYVSSPTSEMGSEQTPVSITSSSALALSQRHIMFMCKITKAALNVEAHTSFHNQEQLSIMQNYTAIQLFARTVSYFAETKIYNQLVNARFIIMYYEICLCENNFEQRVLLVSIYRV